MPLDVLRGLIAIVPQQSYLFADTVAGNLRFGAPAANEPEIWQALEAAQAADFVRALPLGLDTPVSQGGTNFSGGERQRLCIARALLKRAPAYLFDDSFSALDYGTDIRLRAAIEPLLRSATVLIVAERVSTIVDAGLILVLEGGTGRRAGHAQRTHGVLAQLPGNCRVPAGAGGSPMSRARAHRAGTVAGPGVPERIKWHTAARLLGLLLPLKWRMAGVIAATCAFVTLNVAAPKVLGDATDVVVDGFLGGSLDEQQLAERLLAVSAMYVGASLFSWIQGSLTATAVQRLSYGLRGSVEQKLHVLPSSHFEEQRRGDVLSRATNDVDNISQALNQLLNQLIMAILMLSAALAMMLWLSPLLALIAILSVPVSTMITVLVARHSQAHFKEQWSSTGALHAQLEEFFTGHEVVKAFGRQEESAASFRERNEKLTRSSTRAQYLSGIVQPLLVFVANLNYIAIAVVGALQVTAGLLTIGGIQAFVQFSRLFSQPVSQIGGMLTLVQSCLASAERVFELLDAPEIPADSAVPAVPAVSANGAGKLQGATAARKLHVPRKSSNGRKAPAPGTPGDLLDPGAVAGRVTFEHVSFSYSPGTPVVKDLSFTVDPGQTVAIVGHTGAGKTTWSTS